MAGLVNFLSYGQGTFTWTMGYGHGQTSNYEYVWHFSLLDFLFGALILNLVSFHSGENIVRKLLEAEWLVLIGRVSYGMYVFHWAVLVYFFNRFLPTQNLLVKLLIFLPYVFVVYLVAALSYRFYESKFIALKDKIFPSKTNTNQKLVKE